MRVISGIYKGRNLEGYTMEGTRPTMDRIKESLFAMIQTKVKGATVLDLFAGSGALGIEALSNGAESCHFVDHSKKAIQTIQKNIAALQVTQATVYLKDYKQALLEMKQKRLQFDLVFLDPPYHDQIFPSILDILQQEQLLKEDALIVCEVEQNDFIYEKLPIYKERTYGNKKIKIYQKTDPKN